MKFYLFIVGLLVTRVSRLIAKGQFKVVCYYNSYTYYNQGNGVVRIDDLTPALPYCTHLVYGFADLDFDRKIVVPRNVDKQGDHYRKLIDLKAQFPDLKILLGVGGQVYSESRVTEFLKVLRKPSYRSLVLNSTYDLVKTHGFDGVNLAWELPVKRPKKFNTTWGSIVYWFREVFGLENYIDDEEVDEHKHGFTNLISIFYEKFQANNLSVSTTVMPNVDFGSYYDTAQIWPKLDFIVLSTFDYCTPGRTKKEADLFAPLNPLSNPKDRISDWSLHTDLEWWITNDVPKDKLIVGVPTFGRAWSLHNLFTSPKTFPPLNVDGPAPKGNLSDVEGLRSAPETCKWWNNATLASKYHELKIKKGEGSYGYEPKERVWVTFEEPETAVQKAKYVKNRRLRGVGIFYLDLDDAHGLCDKVGKFPILRNVQEELG